MVLDKSSSYYYWRPRAKNFNKINDLAGFLQVKNFCVLGVDIFGILCDRRRK